MAIPQTSIKMRNILNLRNDFLHSGARHTSEEINKAISDANEIIEFLLLGIVMIIENIWPEKWETDTKL